MIKVVLKSLLAFYSFIVVLIFALIDVLVRTVIVLVVSTADIFMGFSTLKLLNYYPPIPVFNPKHPHAFPELLGVYPYSLLVFSVKSVHVEFLSIAFVETLRVSL